MGSWAGVKDGFFPEIVDTFGPYGYREICKERPHGISEHGSNIVSGRSSGGLVLIRILIAILTRLFGPGMIHNWRAHSGRILSRAKQKIHEFHEYAAMKVAYFV